MASPSHQLTNNKGLTLHSEETKQINIVNKPPLLFYAQCIKHKLKDYESGKEEGNVTHSKEKHSNRSKPPMMAPLLALADRDFKATITNTKEFTEKSD